MRPLLGYGKSRMVRSVHLFQMIMSNRLHDFNRVAALFDTLLHPRMAVCHLKVDSKSPLDLGCHFSSMAV